MIKNKWFSIIELLVAILVFAIWLVSIYALVVSSVKLWDYNKNFIIASNLAREQVELVRNIRDTNYKKLQKYSKINPNDTNFSPSDSFFETWSYYKIYNDYSVTSSFSINVEKLLSFWEWESELSWKMKDYQLCLNIDWTYSYVNSSYNCPNWEKTYFYKYVSFEDLKYSTWWTSILVQDAFKLKSKVIWNMRWYHEFELNTIIADRKRL